MLGSRSHITYAQCPRATRSLFNLKKRFGDSKEVLNDYTITPTTYAYRLSEESATGQDEGDTKSGYVQYVGKKIWDSGGFDSLDPADVRRRFNEFPLTSFSKLYKKSLLTKSPTAKRPKRIRMLSSDFIEDSLYNPKYGYFSKEVEIYHPSKPFDYNSLKNQDDFIDAWQQSYQKYDQSHQVIDSKTGKLEKRPSLQLWHTPTELFQPYYGEALARYLLVNYMLNQYPYKDLLIYEMGGGNGTLMMDILNYIEEKQPEVYAKTKYRIIEISSKLSKEQLKNKFGRHADKIEIINKSIFEWEEVVFDPCFFIALEVFDNFAHDVIRYDVDTNQPHQGYVITDEKGDFKEFFDPKLDEWAEAFLALREQSQFSIFNVPTMKKLQSTHPLHRDLYWNKLKCSINPFKSNLSDPEFIPSRLLKFFHVLKHRFPEHQLLASDFTTLPKAIRGYNSPVVQTMLNDTMVTVDTYMVQQGYFDIMFPTNFDLASDLYRQVVGKLSKVSSHREFLEQWADIEATTTKKGENPMLEFYKNAAFLFS